MKKTLLITASLSLLGLGAYTLVKQTDSKKQNESSRKQKRDKRLENNP